MTDKVINPLIKKLQDNLKDGDYSTVPSELVMDSIISMTIADEVINQTIEVLDELKGKK